MKKRFLLIFLLFLPAMAFCQTTFTLKQCLDYADENNRKLQKDKLGLETSRLERKELVGSLLPQVSASGGITYNIEKTTFAMPNFMNSMLPPAMQDPDAPRYMTVTMGMDYAANWGAALSQQILNFSLFNALAIVKSTNEMTELSVEESRSDMIAQTASLYYNIQILEYALTQFDATLEIMDSLLTIMEVNEEVGMVRQVDVGRVTVQKFNLETERTSIKQALEIQKNLLKLQMGFPMSDSIQLTELDTRSIEEQLHSIRYSFFNLSDLPAYRIMEQQNTLAELNLRGAKSQNLPVITLTANWSMNYMGDDFSGETFNRFPMSMVSLNMRLPLFTGMSGNARIRKAKVEIMKSHQDRQQMEQALAMGYSNARIQLDKNLQTIVSQRKNMDLAREVFEITRSNYSEGISSLSDLLNTSASLIQAQMNYVNALNNCMKAYIDLKRADGTINELNL